MYHTKQDLPLLNLFIENMSIVASFKHLPRSHGEQITA